MTVVSPEGTPTLGATKVTAVVSIADEEAPSLASEISAATSVDISCYLYPEGWAPDATTQRGQKKARLCSKTTIEALNRTNYTFGNLQYVHDPQAADSAPGNEARELLQDGMIVHLLERQGPDAEDVDWAATQHSISHKVKLGPQIRSGDRTDDNGEFFITQALMYIGAGPVPGVVVA